MKNKMKQVAKMFGKQLGEEFMIRWEDLQGNAYIEKFQFSKFGLMKNRGESSRGMLMALLSGQVQIMDDTATETASKMGQVAKLFGKRLDEKFKAQWETFTGQKVTQTLYFSKLGLMRNQNEDDRGMLTSLLLGEAQII